MNKSEETNAWHTVKEHMKVRVGGTVGRIGKQSMQGPVELSDNDGVAELRQLLPGTGTSSVSWSQSHVEPMASQRRGPHQELGLETLASCHSESTEGEAWV